MPRRPVKRIGKEANRFTLENLRVALIQGFELIVTAIKSEKHICNRVIDRLRSFKPLVILNDIKLVFGILGLKRVH